MIREHYQPLKQITAQDEDQIVLSNPSQSQILQTDSPALDAMTDLRRTHPVSISPDENLQEARSTMIVCGVRLLFVHNAHGYLLGLLTATDLAGERALVIAHNTNRTIPELTVQDVMTKVSDLEFLDFSAVARAEIGHIIATLKNHNRQHALVINKRGDKTQVIGLFSSTQVARLMGIPVIDSTRANTFAEIEAIVASI